MLSVEKRGWTKLLTKDRGRKNTENKKWGASSNGGMLCRRRVLSGALTNLGLVQLYAFRSYSLGLPLTMKSFTANTFATRKDSAEAWRCNTHLRLRWPCYFHLEAEVTKTCGMSAEIREPSLVLTCLDMS